METISKIDQKTITIELADAIASFNIDTVAELLSENGEYCVQDEKGKIVISNKEIFINWLNRCFDEFKSSNDGQTKLNYILDQCLHCRIGNPVIILENGKFPVFTEDLGDREKCGLMLEFDNYLVSGIAFCFLFLKTDNPYLFEKKCPKKS